ncbi:HTH-type transcriptional activator RhaS [bioreactor metagenome]|uniref:HTH-type transcriptional activator RhaS n=1 Tax=bioreactor metagenome TaxID=1076179 RepID=A0A645DHS3_9ZZZZ
MQQVLAERGAALHLLRTGRLFDFDRDYRERIQELKRFLAGIQRPFALILASSRLLALLYRVLTEMEIRVPEEVAVLANTDDWSVTENAIVPTSYIGGEFQELSSRMLELLDRMMEGERVPEKMVYAVSSGIVSRRSTDTLAVSDLRLARAVSFLLQNYMNCISIRDAAEVAGVSNGMLIRFFRNHFGTSPLRFLNEIRLNRIRHLLDSTDLTLAEIARQTGYGSDMALSLAFRRETGGTPGTYRNSRRRR